MAGAASDAPTLSATGYAAAREAVARTSTRLAELLRAIRDVDRPALGTWDVGDVAGHVTHAVERLGGEMALGWTSPLTGIQELSAFTRQLVADDGERDPVVLADRVEAAAAAFLEATAAADGTAERAWLVDGVRVPLSTVTCHMLNEMVVHGYDIARADGHAWPIDRHDAALVVHGFILAILARNDATAFLDAERTRGVSVTYLLRLRGGPSFRIGIDDGRLSVGPPSGVVDCTLSVDPVSFLLVGWGRESQWRHIARGGLLTWGRRPWMAVRFASMLRNP